VDRGRNRGLRATGALRCVPFFLMLKAEALQIADRTSEALEAIREAEGLVERFEERCGVPTCIGFAVCFSPLWVRTRSKLGLRSAKPSTPQGSRSRFRWRDARKQATQNIGGERRACQEYVRRLTSDLRISEAHAAAENLLLLTRRGSQDALNVS
jgi:hypothetical protein